MHGEINGYFYHKTYKEASTVLCSVVKQLGSGRALKKWGKTLVSTTAVSISRVIHCFPFQVIVFLMLPAHGIRRETVYIYFRCDQAANEWARCNEKNSCNKTI